LGCCRCCCLLVRFCWSLLFLHGPFQFCALSQLAWGTRLAPVRVLLRCRSAGAGGAGGCALARMVDGVQASLGDLWFARGVGADL